MRILTIASLHKKVTTTSSSLMLSGGMSSTVTLVKLSFITIGFLESFFDQYVVVYIFIHRLEIFIETLMHMRKLIAASVAAHGVAPGYRVICRLF